MRECLCNRIIGAIDVASSESVRKMDGIVYSNANRNHAPSSYLSRLPGKPKPRPLPTTEALVSSRQSSPAMTADTNIINVVKCEEKATLLPFHDEINPATEEIRQGQLGSVIGAKRRLSSSIEVPGFVRPSRCSKDEQSDVTLTVSHLEACRALTTRHFKEQILSEYLSRLASLIRFRCQLHEAAQSSPPMNRLHQRPLALPPMFGKPSVYEASPDLRPCLRQRYKNRQIRSCEIGSNEVLSYAKWLSSLRRSCILVSI